MARETNDAPVTRFRPERPIYLNEQNTNCKTKMEVLFAIEQLREKGWLCCYGEITRPYHLSFNDEKVLAQFKKHCSALDIKMKAPPITSNIDDEPFVNIVPVESNSSVEDPNGVVHIES